MVIEGNPSAMGAATIRDVAAAAGVSLGTVSNALNSPEKVSAETLQRIEAAIRDLGYVRNAGAVSMRAGRAAALTIGLIVLDIANPFFTEVARGAEDAANAEGRLVILCNSDEDRDKELRYLRVLEEQRVLGALISPIGADLARLSRVRERGMAVVLLERRHRGFCSVSVDGVSGALSAVSHLLELGHTRIAYISPSVTVQQYKDRWKGAQEACRRAGLDPADTLVQIQSSRRLGDQPAGNEAGRRIIEEKLSVTAAFAANDLIAIGLIKELAARGISVPGKFSVVGFDDIDAASHAPVPLTTVRQPARELGRMAAQLLLAEAKAPGHAHSQVVFDTDLVVRESSAAPPPKRRR